MCNVTKCKEERSNFYSQIGLHNNTIKDLAKTLARHSAQWHYATTRQEDLFWGLYWGLYSRCICRVFEINLVLLQRREILGLQKKGQENELNRMSGFVPELPHSNSMTDFDVENIFRSIKLQYRNFDCSLRTIPYLCFVCVEKTEF